MSDDYDAILTTIHHGGVVPEDKVTNIMLKTMEVLYSEPNILVLESPIVIVGDIHGQLEDLLHLFDCAKDKGADVQNTRYLFMGDYVDRGYYSMNTLLLLLVYKLKYGGVYLLRGNHESRYTSQLYGFYNEVILNYGHAGPWNLANDLFDLLPICALIDNDIFSVHGGLSPDLPMIEMISTIERQKEIPQSGGFADLCWSDPDDDCTQWRPSPRGAGYIFGLEQTKQFTHLNRLSFITRSHQLVQEGYKSFFQDAKLKAGILIDVWSAPNYEYRSGNMASFLLCRFKGKEPYQMVLFEECQKRLEKPVKNATSYYFL